MTRADVAYLLEVSIRYTCAKLSIDDFGVISHEELLGAIRAVNPAICSLLTEFITSYQEWFAFSVKCDEEHKNGQLTADEYQKLLNLIQKRDQSRIAITDRLKQIR